MFYQTKQESKKSSHKRERNQSRTSNKVKIKQSANTSWLLSKQQHKLISFPFYQPHNACIFVTINNTKFVFVCMCVCIYVNNVQVCFATGSCFFYVCFNGSLGSLQYTLYVFAFASCVANCTQFNRISLFLPPLFRCSLPSLPFQVSFIKSISIVWDAMCEICHFCHSIFCSAAIAYTYFSPTPILWQITICAPVFYMTRLFIWKFNFQALRLF